MKIFNDVLEWDWNQENDLSYSLVGWSTLSLFLFVRTLSSSFVTLPLGLHEVQARMVPAKGTTMLK